MALFQNEPVTPPAATDDGMRDFSEIAQRNLEELFRMAHTHSYRTTEPDAKDGAVGDIFLVELGSQTYIYVKFPAPTNWQRLFAIPGTGGYDDLRVPGTSVRSGASAPGLATFAGSGTLYIPVFSGTGPMEEVYFSVQMPHSWKEGTTIYPHVHWSPTTAGAGDVKWNLEYTFANVNETFPAATTISLVHAASGTPWQHQVRGFGGIDMTGKKISCMFHCRLYRNSGDVQDTYAANAAFLEFDFHFQQDAIGSEEQFVK